MASGDKFYLADKATLDEVKGKVGNTTDTGGSSTAGTVMAKENAVLGEVGKIGATNDAQSSSTTTGSIFAKLNYLVSQISLYLSNIFTRIGAQTDSNDTGSKSSSAYGKLNWFIDLFGKTDDTGATVITGTAMGKLNSLITQAKLDVYKYMRVFVPQSQTDYTLLVLSGRGKFYGIYGSNLSSVKLIVDNAEYIAAGYSSGTRSFRGSVERGIAGYNSTGSAYTIDSIPFKNSLVIKVSTEVSSGNADIIYGLYE